MNCPACFFELSELNVVGIKVDVCAGGCAGIWFDAFELQRIGENYQCTEELIAIQRGENFQVNFTLKRSCPRCPEIKLMRHFYSPNRTVEVDECPNCGGFWVDAGELSRIQEEKSEKAATEMSQKFGISPQMVRYFHQAAKTPLP